MKRFIGIKILAMLNFSLAALLFEGFLVILVPLDFSHAHHHSPRDAAMKGIMLGVIFFVVASVPACTGIGLWKLRNWAHIMALCLHGLRLASVPLVLAAYLIAPPVFPKFVSSVCEMALSVWVVWYLPGLKSKWLSEDSHNRR